MENTKFQITEDGSVGLYDYVTGDIYHSITGAYRESYEKFIQGSGFETFARNNDEVSILDICYGIGYNSKVAINSAIKNNCNIKIKIDALETNTKIVSLSPFIKDNIDNVYLKIKLLSSLSNKISDFYESIQEIVSEGPEFKDLYLDASVCPVIDFIVANHNIYTHDELYALLHNIYYQNISNSMENGMKDNDIINLDFDIKFGDARQTIDSCNLLYDFVFLDGFTPSKQPNLWTYQFLSKVKSKVKPDSVFVTYSNSSPVRKTLLDLGFNISKIVLDNKSFGTVATLNENILGTPLDDFEIGLLNTKSGIPYLDNETLSLSADEILNNRQIQMRNSDLMSSTKYIKKEKHEIKI